MTGIVLALGATLGWGTADFIAGHTSRSIPALVVYQVSQWTGLAVVAAAALIVGLKEPAGDDLAYAAIAGASLVLGLGALYQAMAVGSMAIAAPIAATGVIIPVAVGLASGDDPSTVQAVGLLATVVGVVLCFSLAGGQGRTKRTTGSRSRPRAPGRSGRGHHLDEPRRGELVRRPVGSSGSTRDRGRARARHCHCSAPVSPRPPRHAASAIAAIGVIDLLATGLFTAATINGELSLVAVVGSLYPVVTVVLALVVLSERIERHQLIGAFTALSGVALISSG